MINIDEINETISELEQGDTTFATCQKLAALYTVRDNFKSSYNNMEDTHVNNEVIEEYSDILPMYRRYCEVKRKYQHNEITEEAVIKAIEQVAQEIKEFMQTLYANVETTDEKKILTTMIADLKTLY